VAQDKVEIVRSIYERWGEGDFGTDFELLDPYVVFVLSSGFPEAGTYLGTQAVREYMRGFLEPWTRLTIEAEEVVPAGDSVLVTVRQRGVGDASGAATELRYFQLWSFRGDKVIRLENFRDRDRALEAAGLSG